MKDENTGNVVTWESIGTVIITLFALFMIASATVFWLKEIEPTPPPHPINGTLTCLDGSKHGIVAEPTLQVDEKAIEQLCNSAWPYLYEQIKECKYGSSFEVLNIASTSKNSWGCESAPIYSSIQGSWGKTN